MLLVSGLFEIEGEMEPAKKNIARNSVKIHRAISRIFGFYGHEASKLVDGYSASLLN